MNNSFQYQAIKFDDLDEKEEWRLKVAMATQEHLSGVSDEKSCHLFANKLVGFIKNPSVYPESDLFTWLLTYGNLDLIAELIERIFSFHGTQRTDLQMLQRAGLDMLLPHDHITPDIQLWGTSNTPTNALICFTGNAQKLNMPVQLFHSLVVEKFDLIIYLRDPNKKLFTKGVPGIAANIDELTKYIQSTIPHNCDISILGTSGGGYAAMSVAETLHVKRIALFSPPLTYKSNKILNMEKTLPSENVRLYFAQHNESDVDWANDWKYSPYHRCIRWLNTDSHGTFMYLYRSEGADHLINWLRNN